MEKGYIINEEEMVKLVQAVSNGVYSRVYKIDDIEDLVKTYYVSKCDMIGIYFDDLVNQCETREEMIKYINEVTKEWGGNVDGKSINI